MGPRALWWGGALPGHGVAVDPSCLEPVAAAEPRAEQGHAGAELELPALPEEWGQTPALMSVSS